MRIAIFSDVHGNRPALESVLADIATKHVDAVYCLGDLVGYGASPNECAARIRADRIPTVMGNYDDGVGFDRDECGCAYRDPMDQELGNRSLAWTRAQTTPENKAFLRTLLPEIRFSVDGRRILLVHGSPRRPYLFEYILEEDQARGHLDHLGDRLCFYGHTHLPRIFTQAGEFVPPVEPETAWFELAPSALVNPGSVGQPRDGHPDAAFAVVDLEQRAVQFGRVPYDVPRTQAKILDAGLPPIEAARLTYGR